MREASSASEGTMAASLCGRVGTHKDRSQGDGLEASPRRNDPYPKKKKSPPLKKKTKMVFAGEIFSYSARGSVEVSFEVRSKPVNLAGVQEAEPTSQELTDAISR